MEKIDIRALLAEKKPNVGNTLFIAIDGHGGSGKSTLAKILSEKLPAEIIRVDDFSGWGNPVNWHALVIEKVFQPILSGAKTLTYQPVSWWEDHHPQKVIDQPVTTIMILEGVGSTQALLDTYISLKLFVDTPKNICLARGIERDKSTGKSEKELLRIWENWFQIEGELFLKENPKERADVVLDGTRPFEEQIVLQ